MVNPSLPDDVQITPGNSDQLNSVMRVMNSAFGENFGEAWTRSQLSGILPMAGVFLTVAEVRSTHEIIGFYLVRTILNESELLLIAVLPTEQRRGLGKFLLKDFLERARNEGIRRVHLEVRDGNPAIRMYDGAGFSPVGVRRNYYHAANGNRYDAITLACEL